MDNEQLRIRIECTFGMLVQRWRILQAAIPRGISVQKTIALVNCLAKLHNFCIDQTTEEDIGIPDVLPIDRPIRITGSTRTNAAIATDRFITLDEVADADGPVPTQLLGGGEHFDDLPSPLRRPRNASEHEKTLPRYRLHQIVIDSHMVRPSSNAT